MATTFFFIFLLLLSFFTLPSLSISDAFVYGGCSELKYVPNSPYESNLNSLLTSLVNSATYSSYNKYTITGSSPNDVVYGLFQCRGDLAMPDCATCVARSVSQIGSMCPHTAGAAIQLEGCFVKYDNISFIGVEDKSVVLHKCAPSIGYDTNLMNRRDAVLGSLGGSGTGPFRVSGSGDVQGMAQCVQDLSTGECQDCLKEAIGRLKSDCGGAVYGDMFLAKCYARYSTSGARAYTKSNHGNSHSDGEKTFAIIIGLLAGVALVIIFLTFLKKVFGGQGK
ncbi:Cysteine-rich repeat secretory protein 60 [Heracleum sosnowskyi]|uniref:Cysteine-rich repeat secretory protein 60 n=1 Tax=Heracleum sosnowskyi TaxID=360622 RepID=A0AAD8JK82_9APIA|nr:Cysteine-rich repeat secretory protein 60 [Heracleum sosnowskyi]